MSEAPTTTASGAPRPTHAPDDTGAWDRFLVPLLYTIAAAVTVVRLVIVTFVSDASDDHLAPVDLILSSGRMPRLGDCFECYHPKLLYVLETSIIHGFGIHDRLGRLELGGWIDWASTVLAAAMLAIFLRWQRATPLATAIAFTLSIAAPGITLIATQPSNDGLVAGLSALTIALFYHWSGTRQPLWLVATLVAGTLAATAKGSGLVILASVLSALFVQSSRFWRGHLAQLLLLLALAGGAVAVTASSGYYLNYVDRGTPLASNIGRSPAPPFLTAKRRGDGGVNSIAEAFLGFPILSAIETPYIGYGDSENPAPARTNLWTMMHGNHLYSRFLLWPAAWHSTEPFTVAVGRLEVALGVVPLGLMLFGLARRLRDHGCLLVRHGLSRAIADRETWLSGIVIVTVAMIINLAANYRWAPSMKAFYAYPALIGFAACLLGGLSALGRRLATAVGVLAAILASLHLVDAGLLAADLSRSFNPRAMKLAGYVNHIDDRETDLVASFSKTHVVSGKARSGTEGDPVFCDRTLHDRAIGASAPSEVDFPLDGTRARFLATVCNAPKTPRVSTGVHFQIFVDDRMAWDSGLMIAGASRAVDVSVAGATMLRLVTLSDDKSSEDAPAWIDPRLR